jgi:hypothetical protein
VNYSNYTQAWEPVSKNPAVNEKSMRNYIKTPDIEEMNMTKLESMREFD